MEKRLYKSHQDRVIAGVCGGVAEYLDLDPTLIRLMSVVMALASGGGFIIAYIILSFVLPEEHAPAREPSEQAAPLDEEGDAATEKTQAGEMEVSEQESASPPRKKGDSHLLGWILVAVGLYFILDRIGLGKLIGQLWPLLLVVVGLAMLWPWLRNR